MMKEENIMKRIFIEVDINQVGCEHHEAFEVPDDMTAGQMDDMAQQIAYDWAESYGVYPCDGGDECEGEDCENDHDGAISGWWVPYDPEKHDGYSMTGKWFE